MTKRRAMFLAAYQVRGCHGPINVPCNKCVFLHDEKACYDNDTYLGAPARAWLHDHPTLWERIKKAIRGKVSTKGIGYKVLIGLSIFCIIWTMIAWFCM
jgi:hypothetical protein